MGSCRWQPIQPGGFLLPGAEGAARRRPSPPGLHHQVLNSPGHRRASPGAMTILQPHLELYETPSYRNAMVARELLPGAWTHVCAPREQVQWPFLRIFHFHAHACDGPVGLNAEQSGGVRKLDAAAMVQTLLHYLRLRALPPRGGHGEHRR